MSNKHIALVCQWRDTLEPHITWVECSCGVMTDSFSHNDPEKAKQLAWEAWEKHHDGVEARGRQIEYERHRAGNCYNSYWVQVEDPTKAYCNITTEPCPPDWQSCPLKGKE